MKKLLSVLITFFYSLLRASTVYADVLNTIVNTGAGFNQVPEELRMVYSKEVLFRAMPNMRFYQFATIKEELGVTPGLTISMMTYDNIASGGTLVEGVPIQSKPLSASLKTISVKEKGNSIRMSQLMLQASFDDIMNSSTTLLARDYAKTLDKELRDTVLKNANVIFGRKHGDAKIASRTAITVDNPFTVATVKDGVEILATNNAPKFEGNYYISVIHPHQSRDLRDDPAWINASNYGAPDQLFKGEIGRIDDVRFIETTLMCNGAVGATDDAYKADLVKGASGGSATVPVYQASIFGENYYGLAIAYPVEIRDEPPKDFGREHAIAWYGIWGADILNAENGVVLETC